MIQTENNSVLISVMTLMSFHSPELNFFYFIFLFLSSERVAEEEFIQGVLDNEVALRLIQTLK